MADHRPAASVCLLHRESRSILLGKRLVGAWPGYWAFPGGGVDPGESHLEAGVRELFEETGIKLDSPRSILETIVRVAFGERRYEIHNFVIEVADQLAATTTIELEPRWIALASVGDLSPIARGTQTVLDRLPLVT